MSAGESAHREAAQSRRHAEELSRAAEVQHNRADSFDRGSAGERRTAELLASLTPYGFTCLHDRAWPGTRQANIDHIVVGPSGVFVIDTKDWSHEVTVVDGRLKRGQADAGDDTDKVRGQADAVRTVLADVGLPPNMIHPVIALHGRDLGTINVDHVWVVGAERLPREIQLHPKDLTRLQVDQVSAKIFSDIPPATERTVVPTSLGPAPAPNLPTRTTRYEPPEDALFTKRDLEDDALNAAKKKSMSDWMTFLHPAQAQYVTRSLNGPGRITGPAGTGKTVVALHRLSHLAERGAQRLLYATFVRTVSTVIQAAFNHLSPRVADRVEFASLHGWSIRFLDSRRLKPPLADDRMRTHFHALAFDQCGEGHTLLRIVDNRWYWRDEVETVIRGRGITDLDEYLSLDRIGRGTKLGHRQRRSVWRLAQAYEAHLRGAKLFDWNDVLRLARDEARRLPPRPAYDVVILDEAQDLPLLGAELVQAMVGDNPNGLLLVGDDQQRVFPGGFRLIEAGIDVRNRSVRLDVNYRNTREIVDFATSLLDPNDVVLLDESAAGTSTTTVRSGPVPVRATFATLTAHDQAFLHSITNTRSTPMPDRSTAVLHEAKKACDRYLRFLNHHGVPAVALHEWNGKEIDAVLVGTPKRAKGLEFANVFMPNVDHALLAAPPVSAEISEYEARRRREVYVGMTRARTSLWVGSVDAAART